MKLFNRQETISKRRGLRKTQTDAEKKLWQKLRNKQFLWYKFFRQYGISSYIVDFYCAQLKLVIELDGSQHYTENGLAYDEERKQYMCQPKVKMSPFVQSRNVPL